MKRWLCSIGAILLTASAAAAQKGEAAIPDEPPTYEEFANLSQNGKYLAEVKHEGGGSSKEGWILRVSALGKGDERTELWSTNYAYDGYPSGWVTNDGTAFVYASIYYYPDKPVVRVYREGKELVAIMGRQLDMEERRMEPTSSGKNKSWMVDDKATRIREVPGGDGQPFTYMFDMFCRDAKRRTVDLQTGALSGFVSYRGPGSKVPSASGDGGGGGARPGGGGGPPAVNPDDADWKGKRLKRITAYTGDHADLIAKVTKELKLEGLDPKDYYCQLPLVLKKASYPDPSWDEFPLWHVDAFKPENRDVAGNPGGKCRNAIVNADRKKWKFTMWQ